MKLSKASLAVLAIQLALVFSIAAKYYYQRATCPHVWTRAVMYDPYLIMRGRYLSMQLTVDACGSTPPSFPGTGNMPQGNGFMIPPPDSAQFSAKIGVKDNRLVAVRIPENGDPSEGQDVFARAGQSCDALPLAEPVDFYIPEHAISPLPVRKGQELWVEVTVPPKGPPRPIQLALKDNGAWKPLAFQ